MLVGRGSAEGNVVMGIVHRKFEFLLVLTVVINLLIMFVVLQMYRSEDTNRLRSDLALLQRLEGVEKFQQKIGVRESFNVRIDSDDSRMEIIGKDTNTGRMADLKGNAEESWNSDKLASSNQNKSNTTRNYCTEGGAQLVGQKKINVKALHDTIHMLDSLSVDNGGTVEFGGWWKPNHCKPRATVAILIPFRKRDVQLQVFLMHMHPILQRQLIAYRIIVIEQVGLTSWNKGAIYNIGFTKALKIDDFDCFIFHDVDLLLENDKNFYGCSLTPAHLSVAVDKFKYKLPYTALFGGVQAFSKEDYITINGYSNIYWGWGGEDDDLYTRVVHRGFKIHRPPLDIGRYTMNLLEHFRSDGRNMKNVKMYRDVKSRVKLIEVDGLRKVDALHYDYKVQEEQLFTRISIDLKKYKELKV